MGYADPLRGQKRYSELKDKDSIKLVRGGGISE